MNDRIVALNEQLSLNTRLFLTSLEGVDDAVARRRPGENSNNMVFIALHVLDARSYLARYVGLDFQHPFTDLEDVTRIEEMEERFPDLEELRSVWRELSGRLAARFVDLADEDLLAQSGQSFPVDDGSVLGGIAFLLGHESFHIGQLAFLRKYFGLGPMAYY